MVFFDHVVGVAFFVEDVNDAFLVEDADEGFLVDVVDDGFFVDDDQVTVDRREVTDEVLLLVYVEDVVFLVEEGVDVTWVLDQVEAVVVTCEDDTGCDEDRDEIDDDLIVDGLTVDDDDTT